MNTSNGTHNGVEVIEPRDWQHPIDQIEATDEQPRDMELFGSLLTSIMGPGGRLRPITIANRLISAIWILRPGLLGGRSLARLAAELKCSRSVLSKHARAFTKKFGIAGAGSRSAKAVEVYRLRALRVHATKKKKGPDEIPGLLKVEKPPAKDHIQPSISDGVNDGGLS